ncbi:unnamed protein product [Amoebophrya sp. A120]|nr:unnamed protein product [Amoebophrya sp. A120]|eukprot:GSA120T00017034001.1
MGISLTFDVIRKMSSILRPLLFFAITTTLDHNTTSHAFAVVKKSLISGRARRQQRHGQKQHVSNTAPDEKASARFQSQSNNQKDEDLRAAAGLFTTTSSERDATLMTEDARRQELHSGRTSRLDDLEDVAGNTRGVLLSRGRHPPDVPQSSSNSDSLLDLGEAYAKTRRREEFLLYELSTSPASNTSSAPSSRSANATAPSVSVSSTSDEEPVSVESDQMPWWPRTKSENQYMTNMLGGSSAGNTTRGDNYMLGSSSSSSADDDFDYSSGEPQAGWVPDDCGPAWDNYRAGNCCRFMCTNLAAITSFSASDEECERMKQTYEYYLCEDPCPSTGGGC